MAASRSGERQDSVLSQQIADAFKETILRGGYRPGERIRQEDIATRFNASRFPVREAFRYLDAMANGQESDGNQALARVYERRANVRIGKEPHSR